MITISKLRRIVRNVLVEHEAESNPAEQWIVVDQKTGQRRGGPYKSRRRAIAALDRLDLAIGGYRHRIDTVRESRTIYEHDMSLDTLVKPLVTGAGACGDCKGTGKYIPAFGPQENCRACGGTGGKPQVQQARKQLATKTKKPRVVAPWAKNLVKKSVDWFPVVWNKISNVDTDELFAMDIMELSDIASDIADELLRELYTNGYEIAGNDAYRPEFHQAVLDYIEEYAAHY